MPAGAILHHRMPTKPRVNRLSSGSAPPPLWPHQAFMPSFPLGMSQNLYRFIDTVIISLLSRHPLACQRAQPFPYTPCQNTSHSTHSANVSRVVDLRKLLISTPANLYFSWPISASFEYTIFQSRVCSRSFSQALDGSVASIFTLHLPSSLAATIS